MIYIIVKYKNSMKWRAHIRLHKTLFLFCLWPLNSQSMSTCNCSSQVAWLLVVSTSVQEWWRVIMNDTELSKKCIWIKSEKLRGFCKACKVFFQISRPQRFISWPFVVGNHFLKQTTVQYNPVYIAVIWLLCSCSVMRFTGLI